MKCEYESRDDNANRLVLRASRKLQNSKEITLELKRRETVSITYVSVCENVTNAELRTMTMNGVKNRQNDNFWFSLNCLSQVQSRHHHHHHN